jgi:hypothetical protein
MSRKKYHTTLKTPAIQERNMPPLKGWSQELEFLAIPKILKNL